MKDPIQLPLMKAHTNSVRFLRFRDESQKYDWEKARIKVYCEECDWSKECSEGGDLPQIYRKDHIRETGGHEIEFESVGYSSDYDIICACYWSAGCSSIYRAYKIADRHLEQVGLTPYFEKQNEIMHKRWAVEAAQRDLEKAENSS